VPTAWEDSPEHYPLIARNAAGVLRAIAAASHIRKPPTIAMAQQWHRDLYDGIPRPFPYYAGDFRDSDLRFPDLIGYEVEVGGIRGVPSADVPAELDNFERQAAQFAEILDVASPGTAATANTRVLHSVLTYCASLHGAWVRIHPFANGNGRTARLWANWAALRYGLPPFVIVKPRPRDPYGAASQLSMTGDHRMMVGVMDQMLNDYLNKLS
jgi:fido (protein-threonine AMPylation protein)